MKGDPSPVCLEGHDDGKFQKAALSVADSRTGSIYVRGEDWYHYFLPDHCMVIRMQVLRVVLHQEA